MRQLLVLTGGAGKGRGARSDPLQKGELGRAVTLGAPIVPSAPLEWLEGFTIRSVPWHFPRCPG